MASRLGSGLAKSMVPITLMRALVPEEDVVLDIQPKAAQWEACHKRLLDPSSTPRSSSRRWRS